MLHGGLDVLIHDLAHGLNLAAAAGDRLADEVADDLAAALDEDTEEAST